jgi:hypothetical protein
MNYLEPKMQENVRQSFAKLSKAVSNAAEEANTRHHTSAHVINTYVKDSHQAPVLSPATCGEPFQALPDFIRTELSCHH